MLTIRRKYIWLAGVALICTLGVVLRTQNFFHQPTVLEHATAIPGTMGVNQYYWLSNRELLIFRGRGRLTAYKVNAISGKETPLTVLTSLLSKTQGNIGHVQLGNPSPDGKSFLWEVDQLGGQGFSFRTYVASLDGLNFHSSPNIIHSIPNWMSDSRHSLQVDVDRTSSSTADYVQLTQWDARSHDKTKKLLPIEVSSGYPEVCYLTLDNQLVIVTTKEDANGNLDDISPRQILDYSLGKPEKLLHQHTIPLPTYARYIRLLISPHADRIAWCFKFARVSSIELMLHQLLSSYKVHPIQTEELWVCRLDGSQMHTVGYIPTEVVNSLTWLPDGKCLSFIYHDALWTVPVE